MTEKIIRKLIVDENSDLKSDALNIQQELYVAEPYSEIKSNEDLLDLNLQLVNLIEDDISQINLANLDIKDVELNDYDSNNTIIEGGCVREPIFNNIDLEQAKPVLSEIASTSNTDEVNLSGVTLQIIDSE